jgi:hypothetical protein
MARFVRRHGRREGLFSSGEPKDDWMQHGLVNGRSEPGWGWALRCSGIRLESEPLAAVDSTWLHCLRGYQIWKPWHLTFFFFYQGPVP